MTSELSMQLANAWHEASWIELIASVLAIAYVVLAIGQHISCWAAAFVSAALYVWVFFQAHLYMDSALNVFYVAMAVYGFQQWRQGKEGTQPAVHRLPLKVHGIAILVVLVVSSATSWILSRYTAAALPFWDSMGFWASIYATYLEARKVYENWHWFFVTDALCACLYFNRHLFTTMLLFCVYLVLILIGMREWRRGLLAVRAAV